MDESDSQEPKVCGCGCARPLSSDHLRGVIYVKVEGKPVLINMTYYKAAYGDPDGIFLDSVEENKNA